MINNIWLKRTVSIFCVALQVALITFLIGFVGVRSQNNSYGDGAYKFTGELERGAKLYILENDTAKEQGYLGELLSAFNEAYKEYGITAVDANMDQHSNLEDDGPYGYGPDVLYQANDALMKYASNRHILPLPIEELETCDQIDENAWNAFKMTEGDSDYYLGVPVNVQQPLLFYRKDLLPQGAEWDKDNDGINDVIQYWNALYAYTKQIRATDSKKYGYMKSLLDPYFSSGFLFSYGAYVFGENNTDASDIGFSAGVAEKGAWIIKEIAKEMNHGCYDFSITPIAYEKLASGDYFATITTPDVQTLFEKELILKGLDPKEALGVCDVPMFPVSGDLNEDWSNKDNFMPARMMGGVHGYAISSYSEYPNASLAFINFATSYEKINRRYELLGIVPARADSAANAGELVSIVYGNLVSGNTVVMPSIRAVNQIWIPLQTFFADIANDAFRTSSAQKYKTIESIKSKLQSVDRDIYNAIWTLQ